MYRLPDLPYGYEALQPVVSAETLRFHHDKHHAKYVENTNVQAPEKGLDPNAPLEVVVRESAARGEQKLFNNAGQAWNHGFFWESMSPQGGGQPTGDLAAAIDEAFGSFDAFRTEFVNRGVNHFASGWVWLVYEGGRLKVDETHDGDTVITREGVTPILLCDLWEHAYYIDYRNDRKSFVEGFFDKLANWRFAEAQLQAARSGSQGWAYPAPA
jgi:Fe-Mn family superoxide dismutase